MSKMETLNFSEYPELEEVVRLSRGVNEPLVYMPVLGKRFDQVRVKSCKLTIDPGVYLIVLEDSEMIYVVDDVDMNRSLGTIN